MELAAENARLCAEIERLERLLATRSTEATSSAAGLGADIHSTDAYYAAFFENSPNDLFVLDVCEDGRFVFEQVNPMVTKSTGYTREMLVGKTPQQALTPANSSRLAEKYRECVETRQRIEYEVTGVAPIGEVVRRTVLVPIIDAAGKVRKILGTSTDLTALRRTEQALFQAQKMEAVGQLTRGFAHDFNNLLTTIIGNLEMLIGHMRGARERALIGAALQAAERGADLTSRLLAFARRQPLRPEPINLNQALANLADMLRSALGGLIHVEIELAPGTPAALVDSKHLELALLNLAINARDAMPDGGILRIATSRETVGPPSRPEHPLASDYVVISVADTGAGNCARIARPDLRAVFYDKGARPRLRTWPEPGARVCAAIGRRRRYRQQSRSRHNGQALSAAGARRVERDPGHYNRSARGLINFGAAAVGIAGR